MGMKSFGKRAILYLHGVKSTSYCHLLTCHDMNLAVRSILFTAFATYSSGVFAQSSQSGGVVVQSLSSSSFIHSYGSLSNADYLLKKDKRLSVAFLGGSITNMDGWRDLVCNWLKQTYPGTAFTFLNAGIPSLGSLPHAFRFKRDVLDKGRVDLLFIESAVNDHVNGTAERTQRRALEGIIRQALRTNPRMNIVLIALADEDKIRDYVNGKVPTEVRVHEDMARHYGLPFINLAEEVSSRIRNGEFTWAGDFKDLHPAPFGQRVYFHAIQTLLDSSFSVRPPLRLKVRALGMPMDVYAYSGGQYVAVRKVAAVKGFTEVPDWKPVDSVQTRPGFVGLPVLEGTQAGSSFVFRFTGDAVGIAVLSGPDAGTIRYRIDAGAERVASLYTEWSGWLHLPWYLLLGDQLGHGEHVLNVVIDPGHDVRSKGTACRIVYFLVDHITAL